MALIKITLQAIPSVRFAIALSKITPQAITLPKSYYKRSHSQNHPISDTFGGLRYRTPKITNSTFG
ncbi:MAG: hypothetical protein HEQ27_20205 [Dolichospermum sp. JUN01]|jgi:hypothetical protein|uniref:hypothetical protein n=1 Tax=Anabaena sp. WA102 TaxID=1647413 RepID=UPI000A5DE055|nr:hypothetical protein [Anabaena sp. WA102]MBO1058702.1 hypothetical protein [Dolichospermum sp. JUN01]QSV52637.1 MAG: hypothetical protein HEP80_00580 [Dolichospermum sp. UKL201]